MTYLSSLYLEKLLDLHKTQMLLVSALNSAVALKSTKISLYSFVPSASSISEQIKRWPDDIPLLPIPVWVTPQKGNIELKNQTWQFFFHGTQGITFTHDQTAKEVSIEFSANGDIGITKWVVQSFLETLDLIESHRSDLLNLHEYLFDELVQLGRLVKISPKILFVEEVFVLIHDS